MSFEKVLGKIEGVRFGRVGYQEAFFGLELTFEFAGGGVVGGIYGGWSVMIDCSEHCMWTEADRDHQNAEMCRKVDAILGAAKVRNVAELKGKPVEITFERRTIKDWRILTEVL